MQVPLCTLDPLRPECVQQLRDKQIVQQQLESRKQFLERERRRQSPLVCQYRVDDGSGWCLVPVNWPVFQVGASCNCGNFEICGGRSGGCNGYNTTNYAGTMRPRIEFSRDSAFNCDAPGCRVKQ